MSRAPVVILACGNPSRGDDALGPWLLERLQNWLLAAGLDERFELIVDFQWQIEHALDLAGRRLALFIDAAQGTPAPFVLSRLEPADPRIPSSHALPPAALLAVLARLGNQAAPPAFVLAVRGDKFELGDGLSTGARRHAEQAFELLTELCLAPWPAAWRPLCSPSVAPVE